MKGARQDIQSDQLEAGHGVRLRVSTSSCFSRRMPFLLHQDSSRFSRTFFCLEIVDFESCRPVASAKNLVTASATVGKSGLTTPIVPDASQPRTSSEAASHDRRFRDLRMYSPRGATPEPRLGRRPCSPSLRAQRACEGQRGFSDRRKEAPEAASEPKGERAAISADLPTEGLFRQRQPPPLVPRATVGHLRLNRARR